MLETKTKPDNVVTSDLDIFTHENILNPLGWHASLRDPAPVIWLNKYNVWATGRHELVNEILKDWKTYCSSAGVGLANFHTDEPWRPPSMLLEADPPDHTGRREVAGRIMSQKNLRKLKSTFEKEAGLLIDRLLDKDEVDGVGDIAKAYILKVFPDAIGLKPEGRENLLPYGDMIFNGFGPFNALFKEATERAEPVTEYIMKCCTREELTDDGLGAQVYEAFDNGEISELEALFIVRSYLGAGLDTTVDTIGNVINCFSTYPEQWTNLRQNPSRTRAAIEEVVRFDSPFQGVFRTTTRDVEIGGVHLVEDEKILISPACANRDPRRWENPDVFDIDRDASGHLGFGYGIHECVGQVIARLEMDAMFGEMIKRVERIELTGPAPRRLNNTLHGFASLPVKLHRAS
jgi:4-methoxybenzoate monooxygenase (O-demethylating)